MAVQPTCKNVVDGPRQQALPQQGDQGSPQVEDPRHQAQPQAHDVQGQVDHKGQDALLLRGAGRGPRFRMLAPWACTACSANTGGSTRVFSDHQRMGTLAAA